MVVQHKINGKTIPNEKPQRGFPNPKKKSTNKTEKCTIETNPGS